MNPEICDWFFANEPLWRVLKTWSIRGFTLQPAEQADHCTVSSSLLSNWKSFVLRFVFFLTWAKTGRVLRLFTRIFASVFNTHYVAIMQFNLFYIEKRFFETKWVFSHKWIKYSNYCVIGLILELSLYHVFERVCSRHFMRVTQWSIIRVLFKCV